jgi:hypothetical protein
MLKTFTTVIFRKFVKKTRVFVLGKPLPPSLRLTQVKHLSGATI